MASPFFLFLDFYALHKQAHHFLARPRSLLPTSPKNLLHKSAICLASGRWLDCSAIIVRSRVCNDNSNGLDNVSLVAVTPTATPEPGSLALLASFGLTGAAFLARHRKQAHKAT